MNNLLKKIRDFIEKISGLYISRSGVGSIILTIKKFKHNAWSSYDCQCQSIIEQFNIDLVIDAGANNGQFAKSLRKYYQGEIHSFEPVSSTYRLLSRTAHSDPNWHTHQFALGREETEHEINVSNATVFSSLLEPNTYSFNRFKENSTTANKEQVLVRRLDDVLFDIASGDKKRRIFLKMDTQGYDLEVFKGLGNWVNQVYALQSELSVIPIYNKMPHWTDCILEFEKADYTVVGMFPVSRDSLKVVEYDGLFVRANL